MKLLKVCIDSKGRSPNAAALTCKSGAGFTLIELLISMGLLTVFASMGLFIAIDQYKNYALSADRNTVVSMLQKARGRSMNNIAGMQHGLAFQPGAYVLFRGNAYANRVPAYDEIISASPAVSISGPTEFVFKQLSGDSPTSGTVTISTTEKSVTLSINEEGRITW